MVFDPILKGVIKKAILSLSGIQFQEFCNELLLKHLNNKFNVVKNKRDLGSDGIGLGETVYAIYSPEKRNLNIFKKKIKEDFDKYEEKWKTLYPRWTFIYNETFTSAELLEIQKHTSEQPWGIENLLEIIGNLSYTNCKFICSWLRIDNNYFSNNLLNHIVQELAKDEQGIIPPTKKPLYIKDKIEINFSLEDRELIIEEYERSLPKLNRLKDILNEELFQKVWEKILRNYNNTFGNFKERLYSLESCLTEGHKEDDTYCEYVRIVIIYFFERCLLGKKTLEEQKNDNSSS